MRINNEQFGGSFSVIKFVAVCRMLFRLSSLSQQRLKGRINAAFLSNGIQSQHNPCMLLSCLILGSDVSIRIRRTILTGSRRKRFGKRELNHGWSDRKLAILQSHSVLVGIGLIDAARLMSSVEIVRIGRIEVSNKYEQYRYSLFNVWQKLCWRRCVTQDKGLTRYT